MLLVFLFGAAVGVFVPDKFAAPAKLVMLGWLASAKKTWSGVTEKVDAAETRLKEDHDPSHNHGTSDTASAGTGVNEPAVSEDETGLGSTSYDGSTHDDEGTGTVTGSDDTYR